MQDHRGMLQKFSDFSKAFSEFLGRPKTVFDIKDRAKLIVLLVSVIAAAEFVLCFFEL